MQTRRLAAIMFTDIVGYTAIMQSDETEALAIRNRHREVFETLHKKHNGKILQYYGDGTLSIFDSAIEAANCSIAMQLAFQEEPKVPLRIGIHTGDILYSDEEAVGDGVNVASRVESMAAPGSIMVSDTIYEYLKNQPDIPLKSMGKFQFKNIERKMEVFAIDKEGIVLPNKEELKGKFADKSTAEIKSLWINRVPIWGRYLGGLALFLILAPFLYFPVFNLISGNAQNEVTITNEEGEEISRDIIRKEDKKRFLVASFNNLLEDQETDWLKTGLPYALEMDWDQDPYIHNVYEESADLPNLNAQISAAKKIDCQYVLQGDYRKDSIYHVDIRLLEVNTGQKKYELSFEGAELFPLIDKISLAVKKELGVPESHIDNIVDLPASQFLTNSESAYKLFVTGVKDAALRGIGAIETLIEAAEADPSFAWANYHVSLYHHRYQRSKKKSIQFSEQAMKHRSRLPEIFGMSIRILNYKVNGDHENALKLTEMLAQLHPDNTTYLSNLTNEYFQQNKYEKVLEAIKSKRKLSGDKDENASLEILCLQRLGELKKAAKIGKKMVKKHPQNFQYHSLLASVYISAKDWDKAEASVDRVNLLSPESKFNEAALAHIQFMRDSANYYDFDKLYKTFAGKYWVENFANFEIDVIHERGMLYVYPTNQSKMDLLALGKYDYSSFYDFKLTFKPNEDGKIPKVQLYERGNPLYYAVKISPEVEEAVSLFKEGKFEETAPKIKNLIPENPELSFLTNLENHIKFRGKEGFEERAKNYEELAGSYKSNRISCNIEVKDGKISLEILGVLIYQETFPIYEIEPDLFINLMALNGQTSFIRKNGKVTGLELIMSGKSGPLTLEKE